MSRKNRIIDLMLDRSGEFMVRAEHLEDALQTLVRACENAGVTQVPAGSTRSDLQRVRDALDAAKNLLPS